MYCHHQIPILVFHVLEAYISKNARIVDQNVYPSKVLNCRVNDRLAILDAVVVWYGFTALGLDLVDYNICGLDKGTVSDTLQVWWRVP